MHVEQQEVCGGCRGQQPALRGVGPVPGARRGEARPAGEARPPDHPGGGAAREGGPAPGARAGRTRRADREVQGTDRPRRGLRPRTRWPRSTWRWTRWPRRCAAPPTAARSTAASTSPSRVGAGDGPQHARRASPSRATTSTSPSARSGPVTVTGDGPLVVREKTHAAAPMTLEQALYEMELVGPRLLPVRGQGEREAVGGLPPSWLRLRRDLPRAGLNGPAVAAARRGPSGPREGWSRSCTNGVILCHE